MDGLSLRELIGYGAGSGGLAGLVIGWLLVQNRITRLELQWRERFALKEEVSDNFKEVKKELSKIDEKVDRLNSSFARIEGRLNSKKR